MTIEAVWKKIDDWFDAHDATQNIGARQAPATDAALRALSQHLAAELPKELVSSLKVHNGAGDFESYELLGCEAIQQWWDVMQKWREDGAPWESSWIPFAADSCGNLLCIEPPSNFVRFVEPRTEETGRAALSLRRWFKRYAKRLEEGLLAVNEEGFVEEPVVAPSVKVSEKLPCIEDYKDIVAAIEADDAAGVLRGLERAGLGLNVCVRYDEPVIGMAAMERSMTVVNALLDAGVDVDLGRSMGERTALFWACWGMSAKLELVELLLAHGADPNAMTGYDGTPLHSAVMWRHADMIGAMLAAGGDPSLTDAKGRTPRAAAAPHIAGVFDRWWL